MQDATKALAELRKIARAKEVDALLSGEHDSRSCFLEVILKTQALLHPPWRTSLAAVTSIYWSIVLSVADVCAHESLSLYAGVYPYVEPRHKPDVLVPLQKCFVFVFVE